ncbi:SipW-dependent-type signal peptide-containing protein [Arthrobacter sp. HMWF013]|uniref:SipW-dependent-type signal peptide-containing protein n=1 Tax=Arthrobacter sp. HMWF013 TaxID=2056849 RepID=UPI000D3B0C00|nr:SipW-dependent-type signal peptide-containing protein [Arthrobacter sp. HMWF013]PTT68498.1 hypothetical protein DBR22_06330 [Arthrobacter sp. HMWF013]
MRIRRSLKAAALIAAAVVLGLLTVQGTYALWSASASAAPGTVQSASFTMGMSAVPSGQTSTMTLADGTPAKLAITPATTLLPGSSVYGGVAVTNNTNAGGTFNTTVTAARGTVTSTGDGSLAGNVTINAKIGAVAADCNTATGYTTLTSAGLTSPAVPKTASTVFCFQVTLNPNAPASVKGQAVNIPLTLTARQLCGVPGGC